MLLSADGSVKSVKPIPHRCALPIALTAGLVTAGAVATPFALRRRTNRSAAV